jgi:hypothetical protein
MTPEMTCASASGWVAQVIFESKNTHSQSIAKKKE